MLLKALGSEGALKKGADFKPPPILLIAVRVSDGSASQPLLPFALLRCLGTVTERLRGWRALRARLTHPFLRARFDATTFGRDVGIKSGTLCQYYFAFFFWG